MADEATAAPGRVWRGIVTGAATVFLSLQLLIPAQNVDDRFFGDDPRANQYSWQMFSVTAPRQEWRVLAADGSLLKVAKLNTDAEVSRADVRYEPHMTEHLCRTVDGAETVERHVASDRRGIPDWRLAGRVACGEAS